MKVNPRIYKAYDVRGMYPAEIDAESAKLIANATVRFLGAKTVVIGEDGRVSSPVLRKAVVAGVQATGCDVLYIGQCTTPMFYYSVPFLEADGGIMITASHNPAKYNGLKIIDGRTVPIGSDNGLLKISELAEGVFLESPEKGKFLEKPEALDAYVSFLAGNSGLELRRFPGSVVVDAGNGVAGIVAKPLFERLGISMSPLFFELDGTFPNRPPDPTQGVGLHFLKDAVVKQGAIAGFAFDGDADRLTVVDETGTIVPAQAVLAVLWKGIPGQPTVIYELTFSRTVKKFFGSAGVRTKVGHSNIARLMESSGAVIGGEASGHFFFKELHGAESAFLAALRILHVVLEERRPLSEIAKPFMQDKNRRFNITAEDTRTIKAMLAALKEKYRDGEQDELDGLTVEYRDWWFNARGSNTEPIIKITVEADTQELLEEKVKEVGAAVEAARPR